MSNNSSNNSNNSDMFVREVVQHQVPLFTSLCPALLDLHSHFSHSHSPIVSFFHNNNNKSNSNISNISHNNTPNSFPPPFPNASSIVPSSSSSSTQAVSSSSSIVSSNLSSVDNVGVMSMPCEGDTLALYPEIHKYYPLPTHNTHSNSHGNSHSSTQGNISNISSASSANSSASANASASAGGNVIDSTTNHHHLTATDMTNTTTSHITSDTTTNVPSIDDISIFSFNVSISSPSLPIQSLTTNQMIVQWLLESDALNRLNVALFLVGNWTATTHDDGKLSSSEVLNALAMTICKLDVGQVFIAGLKLFLPTTGCLLLPNHPIRPLASSSSSSSSAINSNSSTSLPRAYSPTSYDTELNILLSAYVRAHFLCSETPLLIIGSEQWPILTELARLLVLMIHEISSGKQSLTVCLNEFLRAARITIPKSEHLLSVKLLTELFNETVAGTPVVPLPVPATVKSCLFASCKHAGWITLAGSDGLRVSGWGVLTADALYLFAAPLHLRPSSSLVTGQVAFAFDEGFRPRFTSQAATMSSIAKASEHPILCIPLQYVNLSIAQIPLDASIESSTAITGGSATKQCVVLEPLFSALAVVHLPGSVGIQLQAQPQVNSRKPSIPGATVSAPVAVPRPSGSVQSQVMSHLSWVRLIPAESSSRTNTKQAIGVSSSVDTVVVKWKDELENVIFTQNI